MTLPVPFNMNRRAQPSCVFYYRAGVPWYACTPFFLLYLHTNYTPACHHPYPIPSVAPIASEGVLLPPPPLSLESRVEATTTSLCLPPNPPSLRIRAVGSFLLATTRRVLFPPTLSASVAGNANGGDF